MCASRRQKTRYYYITPRCCSLPVYYTFITYCCGVIVQEGYNFGERKKIDLRTLWFCPTEK